MASTEFLGISTNLPKSSTELPGLAAELPFLVFFCVEYFSSITQSNQGGILYTDMGPILYFTSNGSLYIYPRYLTDWLTHSSVRIMLLYPIWSFPPGSGLVYIHESVQSSTVQSSTVQKTPTYLKYSYIQCLPRKGFGSAVCIQRDQRSQTADPNPFRGTAGICISRWFFSNLLENFPSKSYYWITQRVSVMFILKVNVPLPHYIKRPPPPTNIQTT